MHLLLLTLTVLQGVPSNSPPLNRDLFGACVDVAGDLNADGVTDFWVGDPSNRTPEDHHYGKAWAVSGKDGATLLRIDSSPDAHKFGWTLACFGDVDGDGRRDVAVSSCFVATEALPRPRRDADSDSPEGEGAVYVHAASDGALLYVVRGPADALKVGWYASGAGPALASVGDWNADGAGDFAIGWSYADSTAVDSGRVDVVSGRDGRTLASWGGLEHYDRFGFSLASMGDIDGDGVSDLAAGAVPARGTGPAAPEILHRTRSGYVRILSAKGGILRTIHPYDGSSSFGFSVAPFRESADPKSPVQLLVGQPHDDYARSIVTRWDCGTGKAVQFVPRPDLDAWDGGYARKHITPAPEQTEPSLGTRLLAVPDRDGDGKADILVTEPKSFLHDVPAGVVSSATGRPIGMITLDGVSAPASHVGIGLCPTGDLDGDNVEDFAISGGSARCGGGDCVGTVLLVSGKTLKVIRYFVRAGRI